MRRAMIIVLFLSSIVAVTEERVAHAQTYAADQSEIVAMQVELAWLADPELCCYHPQARVEGERIRIRGYLPTKALRAKAALIAVQVAKMTVVSEVVIHAGTHYKHLDVPSSHLLKSAASSLKSHFPDAYKQWNLGLKGRGRFVVTGYADSHAEKLDVSEKLREIPGCVCIDNRLQVIGESTRSPAVATKTQPSKAKSPVPLPTYFAKNVSKPISTGKVELGPHIQPIRTEPKVQKPLTQVKAVVPRPSVYTPKNHIVAKSLVKQTSSPYAGLSGNQVVNAALYPTSPSPYDKSIGNVPVTDPVPSPYESKNPVAVRNGPSPYESTGETLAKAGPSPYQSIGQPVVSETVSPYQTTEQPVASGLPSPYKNSTTPVVETMSQKSPYSEKNQTSAPIAPVSFNKPTTPDLEQGPILIPGSTGFSKPKVNNDKAPGTPFLPASPPVANVPNHFAPPQAVEPVLPPATGGIRMTPPSVPVNPIPPVQQDPPEPPSITNAYSAKEAELHRLIMKTVRLTNNDLQVELDGNTLSVTVQAANDKEADRLYETITRMPALATYRLKMAIDVPY